jgi:hypothetical protein
LQPIGADGEPLDNRGMVQFSIRCHRCVPVEADELERWLELQVADIRADAPAGTVRLSRLSQHLPTREIDIGWLVEIEVPETEGVLARDRVLETVRDMQLLGLHPTLLAPFGTGEWTDRRSGRIPARGSTGDSHKQAAA